MLEQTQSQPNHTSKTKVYLNELVANALRDNIGSKKISIHPQKKERDHLLVLNIKNLGSDRVDHTITHTQHHRTK